MATLSPWQDLIALQRAIEYVAAEEAAYESAQVLGEDQTSIHRASLLVTAGMVLDGVRWPSQRVHALLRIHSTAGVWSDSVFRLLLEGYIANGPMSDMSALWKMFYFGRLLHELSYNYAHNRPSLTAADLRHAITLARRGLPTLQDKATEALRSSCA